MAQEDRILKRGNKKKLENCIFGLRNLMEKCNFTA